MRSPTPARRRKPKALYLNPTLQNPTTLTISDQRRRDIAAVARRFKLPIVEDDAYGFIPTHGHAPFAAIAPDLTWHVAGLAKCIGAGTARGLCGGARHPLDLAVRGSACAPRP